MFVSERDRDSIGNTSTTSTIGTRRPLHYTTTKMIRNGQTKKRDILVCIDSNDCIDLIIRLLMKLGQTKKREFFWLLRRRIA